MNVEKINGNFQSNFPLGLSFDTVDDVSTFVTIFLTFQVRELVSECQCPTQFPMIRVAEGKYRIGDTQVLIFVRVSVKCSVVHQKLNIIDGFYLSDFA